MTRAAIVHAIPRSLNAGTVALMGGVGAAAPTLAGFVAETLFGRPNSTAVPRTSGGFYLRNRGCDRQRDPRLGRPVLVVRGTRWAGPVNCHVVALILAVLIAVPSAIAVEQVRQGEVFNEPRVIDSTGAITRVMGNSALELRTPSTRLSGFLLRAGDDAKELRWNSRRVHVQVSGDRLVLLAEGSTTASVDLKGFDYVREVAGVTARFRGASSEGLVLLFRLRATGRRELVLVYDAAGNLVHRELFHQYRLCETRR